jgi:saccharopine dehydrogenase (NAD+, L-lysine forming)
MRTLIVGAGGVQTQAMLESCARIGPTEGWIAVDRAWRPAVRRASKQLGLEVIEMDPLEEADRFEKAVTSVQAVTTSMSRDLRVDEPEKVGYAAGALMNAN